MTKTTKDADKPKKLTVRRKLVVVAGLLLVVVASIMSSQLSSRRPPLREVHQELKHLIDGDVSLRGSAFIRMLGKPDLDGGYYLYGNRGSTLSWEEFNWHALRNDVLTIYVDDSGSVATWSDFDGGDCLPTLRSYEMSRIEYIADYWIGPCVYSFREAMRL